MIFAIFIPEVIRHELVESKLVQNLLLSFMYKTSYYDDFKCIGSECPNSCCIGWEIDLDINTFQKYRDLHRVIHIFKN